MVLLPSFVDYMDPYSPFGTARGAIDEDLPRFPNEGGCRLLRETTEFDDEICQSLSFHRTFWYIVDVELTELNRPIDQSA